MKKLLPKLICAIFLLSINVGNAQNLKISELLFHVSDVADTGHEYIEIVGTPNATISNGTYFIGLSATQNLSPGFVFNRIDLSGMTLGSNGYLVLLQEGNSYTVDPSANVVTGVGTEWGDLTLGSEGGLNFRNGSFSYFLINTSSTPWSSVDFGNGSNQFPTGIFNTNALAWTILDGIGNMDGSSGDVGYADINFSSSGNGSSPNLIVNTGGFLAGYFARDGNTTGSTAADWVVAEIKGVSGSSFTLDAGGNTLPNNYKGNALDDIGSFNTFSVLTSFPPTITSLGEEIAAGFIDEEQEIVFSDMIAVGDQSDADGTVEAFRVQSVLSGSLKIGTSLATAAAFATGTNDRVDASNNAYWTPNLGIEGNGIIGFDVKAEDNDGLLSANSVDVKFDVIGNLQISEVLFHLPDVPDINNEYFEIKGTADATIPANTYFLCINGEDPGIAFLSFDLGGTKIGSNGYLVFLQLNHGYTPNANSNTIVSAGKWSNLGGANVLFENGSYSYLLIKSSVAPAVNTDYDTNDDGILEGLSDLVILDGIANLDGDAADVAYGPLAFSRNGTGVSSSIIANTGGFTSSYFARIKNTTGNLPSDWIASAIDGATASNFMLERGATYPGIASESALNNLGTDNTEIYSWLGADTDWTNTSNWITGSLPSTQSLVLIPNESNDPVINGEVLIEALQIESGAILTINSGGSLAVTDTIYGNGHTRVLRNKSGNGNYSIIGSPVKNADISDLSASRVYDYDGSAYSTPTGVMTAGKGYFVSYDSSTPTVDLTGIPNSGTIELSVSDVGDGFNLIANPYTAAIERVDFIFANNSILDGNIWIWDDGGSNNGTSRGGNYILVNSLGTISTVNLRDGIDGLKGASSFTGFLGSMQGFLVKANATGNVTFNTTMMSSVAGVNADGSFFRKDSTPDPQILKLSLSGQGQYDEIIIGFTSDATNGKDYAIDGEEFTVNEEISFYSLLEEKPYAIQGLPPVADQTDLRLGFDLANDGSYELSVVDLTNMEALTANVLDTKTGKTYPLDGNTRIPFTTNSSQNNHRFILQVTQANNVLGVADLNQSVSIRGTVNDVEIYYAIEGVKDVVIHNLSGQVIHRETASFQNSSATIKPSLNKNQVYILSVENQKIKFLIK